MHSKLKNSITRQLSRRPSPNATGPSVPAEKDKILKLAENQMKNILENCVSVRSSGRTGKMPGLQ